MIAVAGLVAVAIVVSREISGLADDLDRMRELGCTRAQRIRMGTASALVAALGGAVVAVAGAAALSPLFPLGVARRADPDVGAHVDWVVVAAGFAATVVAVAVIPFTAAVRATRPGRDRVTAYRTSTIAARAAAAGASPPLSHGLRLALERGRGRNAVPVRSAAIGAVLGVLGVTAVLVFGASLDALVAAPARYGAPWDFQVTDETSNTPCGAGDYGLGRQAGIAALTEVCAQSVELDGRPVGAFAYTRLTGRPVRPEIVAGRAPRGAARSRWEERRLVHCTRRSATSCTLTAGRRASTIASSVRRCSRLWARRSRSPTAPRSPVWAMRRCSTRTCSRGTSSGAMRPAPTAPACGKGFDAVPELTAATGPQLPVEIDRLRQIDWLPVALTLLLGAFALLAVGHGLVTGVRRRRRELALLKTLGFVRRQVRATIGWQATALAAIGIVVGVPLGLVVGTLVWRAVADGLGIDASTSFPVVAVAATAVGAVAARPRGGLVAHACGRPGPAGGGAAFGMTRRRRVDILSSIGKLPISDRDHRRCEARRHDARRGCGPPPRGQDRGDRRRGLGARRRARHRRGLAPRAGEGGGHAPTVALRVLRLEARALRRDVRRRQPAAARAARRARSSRRSPRRGEGVHAARSSTSRLDDAARCRAALPAPDPRLRAVDRVVRARARKCSAAPASCCTPPA